VIGINKSCVNIVVTYESNVTLIIVYQINSCGKKMLKILCPNNIQEKK
jgi:hypothetical protein